MRIPSACGLLCLFIATSNAAEVPAFRDPSRPIGERVADLLATLTLEEKAQVLNHKGEGVKRINLRADQWNQCLNGVKWDRPTTLFPTCIAMSATWDPELVQEVAGVLSDEARAIYNGWHLDPAAKGEHKGLIYRAPVINIERNPYWGRNHEAWGEDPHLTGRLGVAYVKGLQGHDPRHLKIAATLKHYAVNNVETDRTKLNALVPEKMLREFWLPHFRDCIVEGRAQSVMASYNAINGTPNNMNRLMLTTILKEEWGMEGFVVSDLGGVKTMVEGHGAGKMNYVDAVAQSVMAGCDFSDREYEVNIPEAVRSGKLTEARLNDAVSRVLRVRMKLGEFDPFESVSYSRISPDVVGSAKHRAVALKAAQQSIVLLQNRDELLPLDRAKLKRVAVLGPLATQVVLNNYNGKPGATVNALQGLKDRLGEGIEVLHEAGCDVVSGKGRVATKIDKEAGFSGGESVKLEATAAGDFIAFSVPVETAGRYEMALRFKKFPSRGIYQLSLDGTKVGAPFNMADAKEGYDGLVRFGKSDLTAGPHEFRFTVVGKDPGSDSFAGHFDKLQLTGDSDRRVELEGVKATTGGDGTSSIRKAAELAKQADVAIVFVGTDQRVEQEGRDRKTLGLTGEQESLVKAVLAVNPKTIVVQMSAGPLTVPNLKQQVPAMLQAWWGGEETGHAVADVLLGTVNPSGHLPHTVYASEAQVPPIDEYDVRKGFTYQYLKGEPLYAFGHGLSYTRFDCQKLTLSSNRIATDGTVSVKVEVVNTGTRPGAEVVQLYVRKKDGAADRPLRTLRGFQRVSLKAGESRSVEIPLAAEKLASWDESTHGWRVEPGDYSIEIGTSSADIRQTATLSITKAAR